ncbi:MAG: transcriptional regulator [Candidatus Thorarchaeota archaeon]
MPTRRETIAALLETIEHPMTAEEICERLDIKKRSIVYEDIDHISKSVKRENKELLIRPAVCGKCQFTFKVGKSARAPGKCPKCKSQWILAPAFIIRQKR